MRGTGKVSAPIHLIGLFAVQKTHIKRKREKEMVKCKEKEDVCVMLLLNPI